MSCPPLLTHHHIGISIHYAAHPQPSFGLLRPRCYSHRPECRPWRSDHPESPEEGKQRLPETLTRRWSYPRLEADHPKSRRLRLHLLSSAKTSIPASSTQHTTSPYPWTTSTTRAVTSRTVTSSSTCATGSMLPTTSLVVPSLSCSPVKPQEWADCHSYRKVCSKKGAAHSLHWHYICAIRLQRTLASTKCVCNLDNSQY